MLIFTPFLKIGNFRDISAIIYLHNSYHYKYYGIPSLLSVYCLHIISPFQYVSPCPLHPINATLPPTPCHDTTTHYPHPLYPILPSQGWENGNAKRKIINITIYNYYVCAQKNYYTCAPCPFHNFPLVKSHYQRTRK